MYLFILPAGKKYVPLGEIILRYRLIISMMCAAENKRYMRTGFYIFFIAVFCFLLTQSSWAQFTPMTNGTINSCAGFFTDPGGENGNYQANQSLVTTICPGGTSGSHVALDFFNLQLAAGDQLCFYDGTNTTAPQLACFEGPDHASSFQVRATAANPSGCLTVSFSSDGAEQAAGWSAQINCIFACQNITAQLDSTRPAASSNPIPTIDICPGERVFFFGSGLYPQNGTSYEHNNANSEFKWDFGNGDFAFGRTVSYRFDESGAYNVSLTITDPFGCTNTNRIQQQVRVAPRPQFSINTNATLPVCAGQELNLEAGINGQAPGADLLVNSGTGILNRQPRTIERIALPDGIGIGYETTLHISSFAPGQTITSVNDLASVCVDLEHSWMNDLEITLICPNGTELLLQAAPTDRGAPRILGNPVDNDAFNLQPGQPFTYCWSETASNPNWTDFLNQSGLDTLPAGTYQPFNSFSNLIGCSLNGPWTLRVIDKNTDENGYYFGWSLNFDTNLFQNQETFSPNLISGNWTNNNYITSLQSDQITALPTLAGTAYFDYEVTDDFGCTFDTTLQVPIKPFTDPTCLDCNMQYPPIPDINSCGDETLSIDAAGTVPIDTAITFLNNPQYALGFANHPPESPYENTIQVSGIIQDTITDPFTQIQSICLNLNTDWDEDINLFLRSPSGQLLELSTNNGGQGDNYTNTCFTPNASISIIDGTAPFRGEFLPEGDWNTLIGEPINGAWTLITSDEFDDVEFGQLMDWSISFHSIKEVTYSWTGDPGLSCTDCPNPEVNTSIDATYIVTINDTYGCSATDTVEVTIVPVLEAPVVSCNQQGADAFLITWNRPPGVNTFSLNLAINGFSRPTVNPFVDTFLVVNGLSPGDSLSLEVLPIILNPDDFCRIESGFTSCVFGECLFNTQLSSIGPITCFDDDNGFAEVRILNGSAPFRYFLNNSSQPQADPRFENLSPGPYFIVSQDATFCTDTVFFEITEPDSLGANVFESASILCFGDANGQLQSLPLGGTMPYRYSWSNGSDSSMIDSLIAGTYRLTITDANGCDVVSAFDLRQPDELTFNLQGTDITCANGMDGQIIPNAQGGTPGYSFIWNDGTTDSLQNNLPTGNYSATLTDARGCTATATIDLEAPDPLQVDSFRVIPVDCYGRETGQASIFVSGGTGPYEYLWNDDLAQIGITASNLPAGLTGLTIIDFNLCTLDTAVFISQPDSLSVSITATDAKCKDGNEGQAEALVAGGTQPYNYFWQDGQITSIASSLSRGNYRITVTDENGCRALATTFIDEPDIILTIDIEQSKLGCFGQQQNEATAMALGGSGGDYNYRWSNGQREPTANNLDSLTYTVSVTDGNGCEKTQDITLVDLPDMVPNMIVNAPSCFGSDNGAIGINFVDGRPNSELNTFRFVWKTGQVGSNINNIVGDSTYTVTVTDGRGCSAIASRYVREPERITFDLETTPATCPGGSNGTALVTNITSNNRDLVYQWDAGTGNQEGISASNLAAGVYQVTVTDPFNCFASGFAIVEEPERIQANFQTVDNSCFGDQAGIASTQISGGTPGYTLLWQNGQTSDTITQLAAGNYGLTITDAQGCEQATMVTINHPPPINVTLASEDVTCFGERDGGIIATVDGGAPPYTYSLNNFDYQGSPLLIGLTAGTYDVFVRDSEGCTLFERSEIIQPEQFVIDAGPNTIRIDRGDTLQLDVSVFGAQGQVLYEWYAPFGDNLSCLSCPNPVASPENTISYEVIGMDSVGCEASDRIQIIVEKERVVLVPTGFTPNGDGNNDLLLVHGKTGTLIERLQVFDRWGELVYQREDFDINDPIGWDGTFRGQDAPVGVYIWYMEVIYPDNSQGVERGQTALIR